MKKEVSRQRRWQLRQKAKKLCEACGKKGYKNGLCESHYWRDLARHRLAHRRRKGHNEWKAGSRGRPPLKIPEGMK